MSFQKNKYIVIRNILSKDIVDLAHRYIMRKKQVYDLLADNKIVSPVTNYNYWSSPDPQVANAHYSSYGDVLIDTLLENLKPKIEKKTDLELIENYTFTRIYKNGNKLTRHIDRNSCEISGTLNLGGDNWSIFLDPTGGKNKEGISIDLNPGDILIYRGSELEHWRETFTGTSCVQSFFHYHDKNGKLKNKAKYDDRKMLGIPMCSGVDMI
jgi:hypothetical protein